jgi:hypothetical protein
MAVLAVVDFGEGSNSNHSSLFVIVSCSGSNIKFNDDGLLVLLCILKKVCGGFLKSGAEVG